MTAPQNISIVTELIREVESYLPEMRAFLRPPAGADSGPGEHEMKELHRMTHTITGAAAMVQLSELSRTAALMEDVLDDILAGKQTLNRQCAELMAETVDHIESYCAALHQGEADDTELYQRAHDAFAKISSHSETADDSGPAEEDLSALLGADEEGETTDDFFQQLSDDEGDIFAEQLETLPDSTGDAAVEFGEDPLPAGQNNDIGEVSPDTAVDRQVHTAANDASPGLQPSAIDPELQESFDEEAEEHLDNIGRQLNELASAVSERCAVSDEHRERLHSIRRSVHTLKGAAAVIGIEPVAAWGHDFEDFLDQLHDESDSLSPETIAALQDGADILEKITANPAVDRSTEISSLQEIFPRIMAAPPCAEEGIRQDISPQPAVAAEAAEQDIEAASQDDASQQPPAETISRENAGQALPIRIDRSRNTRRQTRKRTLRVDGEKIAELMGLSGDMAINLSSFENSASSMQTGLAELEVTLKRLKEITAKFESGYELASIPHLGGVAAPEEKGQEILDEFDPLEMDRYSELHILIRSLDEAVVDLDAIREQASGVQDSWQLAIDRQRRVVTEMQGAVQSIQMTPFSTLANRLYKTVRETARATGKKVRLLIEGGSMEMDTHVWDVLADALMHMLRNCVDHGVEPAEERQLLGKDAQATIRIHCSRRGSRFILRLSDDGSGLDYDAIRARGLSLYPESKVEAMDDRELAVLIFKQGFSIRSKVSSLSGRGVGMDVVRDALDQLNGFVEVHSSPGQGTDFVLSMPIVVAQLPALLLMFGSQQFALPMRDVSRVMRLSGQEKTGDTFKLDDETLPLFRPAELLHLRQRTDSGDTRAAAQDSALALAVEAGGRRGIILVDRVIGKRDVVFKGLGSHLQTSPCVAGATILGDGSLVPILQTEDLFTLAEAAAEQAAVPVHESTDRDQTVEILIADDSISVRKVLSNFISTQGWQPTTAIDGVDAMARIRDRRPDLILLDIEMPRMNGFEVLQSLQSQSAYRDIPVLMLTSRSGSKYREKATGLGARGFVTKPFKDDELTSLITSLTARQTLRQRTVPPVVEEPPEREGTSGRGGAELDDTGFQMIVSWAIGEYLGRGAHENRTISIDDLPPEYSRAKQLREVSDELLQRLIDKTLRRCGKVHEDSLHRLRKKAATIQTTA